METIQKYLDKIETEIDLMNCYNEGMLFSDFEDAIMESINNEDIIYYSEAMSYLIENDTSLKNSLCLASDIGCQVSDINSELLASLLYQENLRNEWYDISEEIEEYFEEYLEYLETLNKNKE